MKSIQAKLKDNDAMITTADKGNSLVIIQSQKKKKKIQDFIDNNNFQSPSNNPTKRFQSQIRKTINHSTALIPKNLKWRYVNLNPTAPTIKGLIKLHKPDQPIRPVVNWRNAPAYKLSQLLTTKIRQFASLPYTFNVRNSTELIRELKQTPITSTSRFASLDITNMYSNIPVKETKQLLDNMLTSNTTHHEIRSEILNCYQVITTQNYFAHGDKILTQTDGLAMGAPSSGIISEIFLQNFEHTHLPNLARKHKLINYFRYVDDILLIYDDLQTDIHTILSDFNSLHPNLQFTKETELDNKLNYLDITILKTPTSMNIGVFRKPTFTDTIIPYTSNHPTQHKYAAIKFLYNRLNSYQLQDSEYQHEESVIQNILHNNSFPLPTRKPKTQTTPPNHDAPSKQKWATFTYSGPETSYITKLFKHTNLKIAYRTTNNIQSYLYQNTHTKDIFTLSGVYELTCPDCGKAYVGQTGRDFRTRFDEHKRAFIHNNHTSKYALHLIEHSHTLGSMQNVMRLLNFQRKGIHLDTIERFHIHRQAAANNHLNDDHTLSVNSIFDSILADFKNEP
jgi:hypothetical protein